MYEDWSYDTFKYEEVKTQEYQTNLIIEDDETCNMITNSNYFGACLNRLWTVVLLGGFGNTERFSVRTLSTVLRTRIEDFVLGFEDPKS